jgi:hypothetical protein
MTEQGAKKHKIKVGCFSQGGKMIILSQTTMESSGALFV